MKGHEIRVKREARGWTQRQLAEAVGASARTIGNWERGDTVPKNRAAMIENVLLRRDDDGSGNPLAGMSDAALLTELLRRAVERRDG